MNPIFILAVSLFVIPLCGPIIIEPIISITDLWIVKEFLCLSAILLISLATYIRGHQHQSKINWPLWSLILFIPISIYAAPPLELIYGRENMAGMWMWRSFGWCILYLMLYCSICSNPISSERHRGWIIWAIGLTAIISAGYAYIQAMNIDQWQITRSLMEKVVSGPPHPARLKAMEITALIGNPTYLATWLAMCLPFLVLFFRWWWVVMVLGAIFICQSDIASAGAMITLIFIACMRARSTAWIKAGLGLAVVGCLVLWGFWGDIRPKIGDNGRFAVWRQTIEDWKSPCINIKITDDMSPAQIAETEKLNKRIYSLTGRGIGSFPFIFTVKHGTRFDSAHNEPLEGLYSIGLIGQTMFLAAIGFVFWFSFWIARGDKFALALYAALFFCFLASLGLPILHIEPLRYFSATMFCILSALIPRR